MKGKDLVPYLNLLDFFRLRQQQCQHGGASKGMGWLVFDTLYCFCTSADEEVKATHLPVRRCACCCWGWCPYRGERNALCVQQAGVGCPWVLGTAAQQPTTLVVQLSQAKAVLPRPVCADVVCIRAQSAQQGHTSTDFRAVTEAVSLCVHVPCAQEERQHTAIRRPHSRGGCAGDAAAVGGILGQAVHPVHCGIQLVSKHTCLAGGKGCPACLGMCLCWLGRTGVISWPSRIQMPT